MDAHCIGTTTVSSSNQGDMYFAPFILVDYQSIIPVLVLVSAAKTKERIGTNMGGSAKIYTDPKLHQTQTGQLILSWATNLGRHFTCISMDIRYSG